MTYFSNRGYPIQSVPSELIGMTFTRRAGGNQDSIDIDAAAGATFYLLVESDKSFNGGGGILKQLDAPGWARLADAEYIVPGKHTLIAIYKQTCQSTEHFSFTGGGWSGIAVASKNLSLVSAVNAAASATGTSSDPNPGRPLSIGVPATTAAGDSPMPDAESAVGGLSKTQILQILRADRTWYRRWEQKNRRRPFKFVIGKDDTISTTLDPDKVERLEQRWVLLHNDSYLFPVDMKTFHGFVINGGHQVGAFSDGELDAPPPVPPDATKGFSQADILKYVAVGSCLVLARCA